MVTRWCCSYRSRRPFRISIVCLIVGSATWMGWNRRSSAASFSRCLRYSSSVLAPMVCSSPRASMGFEVAAVSGPGHQRAEVQRVQLLVLERLGRLALDDLLGQALDDRGLADAGL